MNSTNAMNPEDVLQEYTNGRNLNRKNKNNHVGETETNPIFPWLDGIRLLIQRIRGVWKLGIMKL